MILLAPFPPYQDAKVWEIEADVTLEKDPDYSTRDVDVYTTSEGTVTQTVYTYPDITGLCHGEPALFTDTYPIFKKDGYLSVKRGTNPILQRHCVDFVFNAGATP